jgi:hypothetical protein
MATRQESGCSDEMIVGLLECSFLCWVMLTSVPFAYWTTGDLEPYLTMFPLMVQVIGSAAKPEVTKTMLLKQYLDQSCWSSQTSQGTCVRTTVASLKRPSSTTIQC